MRATHSPRRVGALGVEEARERRRDDAARAPSEHASPRSNDEVRQQQLGLVRRATNRSASCVEQERGAPCVDHRDDRVGERSARPGRGDDRVARALGLALDERGEQRLLAGEAPVDGGPGAAGLAGDVVERGLGQPDPGDAGERGIEDPVGARARCGHH